MEIAKILVEAVKILVFAASVWFAAELFRYDISGSGGAPSAYILDRWTGEIRFLHWDERSKHVDVLW